jgi:hypothetical protein
MGFQQVVLSGLDLPQLKDSAEAVEARHQA